MADTDHPLPVKHSRARDTHRSGLTVYEYPGHGLYQVTEANAGEFSVETLSALGWMTLIRLDEADGVTSAAEAMALWMRIQTTAGAAER